MDLKYKPYLFNNTQVHLYPKYIRFIIFKRELTDVPKNELGISKWEISVPPVASQSLPERPLWLPRGKVSLFFCPPSSTTLLGCKEVPTLPVWEQEEERGSPLGLLQRKFLKKLSINHCKLYYIFNLISAICSPKRKEIGPKTAKVCSNHLLWNV